MRDENGEYSVATRFGKGKKIYHDKKWSRPQTRSEFLHRIEATRLSNRWDWTEFGRFCESVGLRQKPLADYSDDELEVILDNFEYYKMILFIQ